MTGGAPPPSPGPGRPGESRSPGLWGRDRAERLSGLLAAGPALLLALLLFAGGALQGLDDYLTALVFQWRVQSQAVFRPEIFLVKKDERTANLLNKNPARREFASILSFLGRAREAQIGPTEVRTCRLAEFQIGLPADDKPPVWLPTLFPETRTMKGEPTFFRLHEKDLGLVGRFLGWPGTPAAAGTVDPSFGSEFVSELARTDLILQVRVFPNPKTLIRLAALLEIQPPMAIPVRPALVMGLDFLMQGTQNLEEDGLMASAVRALECPLVMAAQKNEVLRGTSLVQTVRSGGEEKATEAATLDLVPPETLPESSFNASQTFLGFINTGIGRRGYLTSLPLFQARPGRETLSPSFCLAVAVLALDRKSGSPGPGKYWKAMEEELARLSPGVRAGTYRGGFRLLDRDIPTDAAGNMEITFFGSAQPNRVGQQIFPSASFFECFEPETLDHHRQRLAGNPLAALLDGATTKTLITRPFSDRICLLGTVEAADMDFYETPYTLSTPIVPQDRMMSGIEINANAILTILDGKFLTPPAPLQTVFWLTTGTLLLGLFLGQVGAFSGLLVTAVALAGAVLLSDHSYHQWHQILRIAPAFIAFPGTWTFSTLFSYIRQKRRAQETKTMFQRFVSADVVQYMLDNPGAVKPGGERVELTVFFSDVAGFTSISEALTPEDLVVLLNEYLGEMTRLLFKHGGTLDKFIGDAVMAFWNYPRSQPDHAIRACRYALEMKERLAMLQKDWARRGLPKISARAGLNTAQVIVGCMGADEVQMNFTCMGDGVNLAARLEGANKEYGSDLMISGSTYDRVKDQFTTRFLDFLTVKGKTEPVKVYQLISEKGKEPSGWTELATAYDKGIELHLARRWDDAIATFEEVLRASPDDGPSKTYLKRCHEYREVPPPENWNGSYVLTHK